MNKIKETIGYADYSWNPIATGTRDEVKEEAMEKLEDPFYLRFWPSRLEEPMKLNKPSRIFVCDMGDLFGDGIPEQWTGSVIDYIEACILPGLASHTFLLLTKQPQNLAKWSPFPDNCEVGISVTRNNQLDNALECLKQIEATVKFISFEPLLERMPNEGLVNHINWVIIGATTGSKKDLLELQQKYPGLALVQWGRKWTLQPKVERVKEIIEAADKAGIPVFLKDNLKPLLCEEGWNDKRLVIDWTYGESEFEGIVDCRLRQELPR